MVGLSSFFREHYFSLEIFKFTICFLGNQEGMYIFFLGWLMLYDNSDYNSKVNKENQKLEFWMRGISIVSGFFCCRISICRNRPVQGYKLLILHINYLGEGEGCKNFLIRISKLRHWYIWVPPKVSAHQQKWARITNYKVQKSLFFCHVKKLSVQHLSSWFFYIQNYIFY